MEKIEGKVAAENWASIGQHLNRTTSEAELIDSAEKLMSKVVCKVKEGVRSWR